LDTARLQDIARGLATEAVAEILARGGTAADMMACAGMASYFLHEAVRIADRPPGLH